MMIIIIPRIITTIMMIIMMMVMMMIRLTARGRKDGHTHARGQAPLLRSSLLNDRTGNIRTC